MSGLFPGAPTPGGGQGPDPMGHLDPDSEREFERRWELRAAEWRAVALAEAAFDGRVVPRLVARAGGRGFRGLLELEVPFDDLESHREAEALFLAWAGRDEVLSGMPMVVLFAPRPRVRAAS